MNIGATVVTSSSEMIRGLVSVTRSAPRDGCRMPGSASTASARRRASGASGTPAAPARPRPAVPTSRCSARSAGGQQVQHHGRGHRDLDQVAASTSAAAPAELPPRPRRPAAHPAHQHEREAEEGEGEHPVGPVQRGEGAAGRQHAAVAEREAEAEEAGVEVGDLGAEQDDHEAERGRGQRPARGAPCRGSRRRRRGPSGAPARSATTSSVASSTIALARWVMITQGGSASLTVTAPSSTCTTSRTSASVAGFRSAARSDAGARPPRPPRSTSTLTSAAAQRWPISIRVGRSSGGNHSPSQRGQWSPQPMPEPVIRTTPPSTMRPKAKRAPVQARRRSRRVRSGGRLTSYRPGKNGVRQSPCQGYI